MRKFLYLLIVVTTISFSSTMFESGLNNQTIKSASELDYPPFSIVLPNKHASGFSVELLDRTIKIMGGDVSFYVDSWANIKKDLEEKRIDVLPVVGRTVEREEYFDFSVPYLVMHGAIFVLKSNKDIHTVNDLKNKSIAVMKGDNAEEYVRKINITNKIGTFPSYVEAFKALELGKYDAVIVQKLVGIKIINQIHSEKIKALDYVLDDFRQDFSFAVSKGNTKLLASLNEGLSILKANGEYDALYQKWFHEDKNGISEEFLTILKVIVIISLLISLFFYFWNRSLKKSVEHKTKELKNLNKHLEERVESSIKEIDAKKQEFEKIIELTPCPIMLHNEEGKVILINQAWLNLSGFERNEIQTIEDWILGIHHQKECQDKLRAHINTLYALTEPIEEGDFSFRNKNKNICIWKFFSAPFGILDNKKVVVTTAMDISEMRKKDDMMISQSRIAAMGEMLSMIAHQWRQPLSIISMNVNNTFLDIELESFEQSKLLENLNSIVLQVQYLSKTIDDFKDFFNPNKEKETESIKTIFENSFKFVEKSLETHNINTVIECSTNQKVSVFSSEVIQVFLNILNNAKDALDEKTGTDKTISVFIFEIDNFIRAKICNNGDCIKEENLEKIFNPYFSTKNQKNGTGLGLYISKMIMEKHIKGNINAQNTENGVCFVMDFPLEK